MKVRLADWTTRELSELLKGSPPVVALIPVGSVEPHGPHLPLGTDLVISETAAERAVPLLRDKGIAALVTPPVPFGVTEFARGFSGALGVPAEALTPFLRALAERALAEGFAHVCLVNNHLEPAHDQAVRAAIVEMRPGSASVACPLTRRWARTLSEEFKRGNCHAGQYETSLVLAADAHVSPDREKLPPLGVSLSDEIRAGRTKFLEMGLDAAYTGDPAAASREEGDELYRRLAEMVATEVLEALTLVGRTKG